MLFVRIGNLGDLSPAALAQPPFELDASNYDSPLEQRFAHHAVKYLQHGLELQHQVPIEQFRLDFFVHSPSGRRVAFECDGAAYHGTWEQRTRDARRDGSILRSGLVDVIYRIRGKDLWFRPEDCFFAIAHWDRSLFSDRGLINLANLASRELRDVDDSAWGNGITLQYDAPSADEDQPTTTTTLYIERRTVEA